MSRVYALLAALLVLLGIGASLWFAHHNAVNAAVDEVRTAERASCKRKLDVLQLEIDRLNKATETLAREGEAAQARSATALAKAKATNKANEARISELQALILAAKSIECRDAVEEVRSDLQ